MERGRREFVKGRARSADVYPRVGAELLLETRQSFVVVTRSRFDPYHEVVYPVVENVQDRLDDLMDW